MKGKTNIWDLIAWLVLFGIIVWLVLKTLGIIATPAWLEYAPIYGAVYLAGWAMHKLEDISNDVNDLKKFKESTIIEINKIKTNFIKNNEK